ncbi:bifunctional 4-hydroxy-2-oxoglutarate aldolase/2-dehydro-3-deoxy-phosphogluconate aldolase [Legionella waltersii]|uniref:2-dehydro-3-deoxy-phosphogluconate aldolase n=1 Tax=Legionella waltersii TaxID=66969 RepID=A0A0W1A2G8_9GAMM|nr:bifunctional 4-hydroxy-2-oxoglutarate aldolase/2-dehydro-3-deoxy-phosphogluconate aldolase [Legionella waltersii]KTD75530.1 bifunctional 2-keto-3-deoxygluconate 6- phosphate aldolase/4-hydroxy-2-oxoglutarate aldolase [Legionella waltersii]SNU98515.1 multifunctional- 2-keto-3-deoxygluconate 6-phosphate aldolase/(4-hydroxy-2-oxoglutarate aldolase) [Legionella waltersii]
MSFSNWKIQANTIFNASLVIPVIVIEDIEQALPLAEAIFASGISILEITLRTSIAVEAIRLLAKKFPQALIGAGTVINPDQLQEIEEAGAKFAISPGLTNDLLAAGKTMTIPLIPGVASLSELMQGMQFGYQYFKFFPASLAGGPTMLRTIGNLFPDLRFCPTGGINEVNYMDYLQLANVSCVGGSWIVPQKDIGSHNWSLITQLCSSFGSV